MPNASRLIVARMITCFFCANGTYNGESIYQILNQKRQIYSIFRLLNKFLAAVFSY